MTAEPVLCFDGDNAGVRAARRAAERALPMLQPGHSLRFALLPSGEDPDTLIKGKGKAAMQSVLDQAIGLSEFLWQSETRDRSVIERGARQETGTADACT